ncbi:phosphodiester glycosidase family protein [Streptomyces sp. NPDC056716]|uniref:phosphodiester glycosidase family protein n=1 Tax=unclassified Streptomyces TaxID=2593676 RepID=UPI0036CB9615
MTSHTGRPPSRADQADLAELREHGYRVHDIESLARDQDAFAVRLPETRRALAPGLHLESRSVDLGNGSFTNTHTLQADTRLLRTEAVSAPEGFHLRNLITTTTSAGAVAAVSGSFSFISDDPRYRPAEPCLDLCIREGKIVSLPTTAKPALLIRDGQPLITTVEATGTLTLAGRPHHWAGSKTPTAAHSDPLTVYGAANCHVRYRDHPRTGFLRSVAPATNTTPLTPDVTDLTLVPDPGGHHRVTTVHPGGGADLFTGNIVLRTHRNPAAGDALESRAPVQITTIGGHSTRGFSSALSLGPSAQDAAAGRTRAWDDGYLGTSPFLDTRRARTLIGHREQDLVLLVLDGTRHATRFLGVTPRETARICETSGLDPARMYHLDGGASSKIAYLSSGIARVAGSMHYLAWPTIPGGPFRWQGLDGRVLRSAVVLIPRQIQEYS